MNAPSRLSVWVCMFVGSVLLGLLHQDAHRAIDAISFSGGALFLHWLGSLWERT